MKVYSMTHEILFVLFNLYISFGTHMRTRKGIFNPYFENVNEADSIIDDIFTFNIHKCVTSCADYIDCKSISYNKHNGKCRLFFRDFTGQSPTGPYELGWSHYDFIPNRYCDTMTIETAENDCSGVQSIGHTTSGLYSITIGDNQVPVWCDLETEGGGWTVFQRRSDGSVDFNRVWNDYISGFGDPSIENWIGNDALNILTSFGTNELLILMETWEGVWRHARYSDFRVNGGSDKYRLYVDGFSGTAGDSFNHPNIPQSGQQFSTRDQDNDGFGGACNPMYHPGGWWFKNCGISDLNGFYYNFNHVADNSCHWKSLDGSRRSLRTVLMMVRKQ